MNTPNSISSWSFFLVLLYIMVGGFHFVGHFVDWCVYLWTFFCICVWESVWACVFLYGDAAPVHACPPPQTPVLMHQSCFFGWPDRTLLHVHVFRPSQWNACDLLLWYETTFCMNWHCGYGNVVIVLRCGLFPCLEGCIPAKSCMLLTNCTAAPVDRDSFYSLSHHSHISPGFWLAVNICWRYWTALHACVMKKILL